MFEFYWWTLDKPWNRVPCPHEEDFFFIIMHLIMKMNSFNLSTCVLCTKQQREAHKTQVLKLNEFIFMIRWCLLRTKPEQYSCKTSQLGSTDQNSVLCLSWKHQNNLDFHIHWSVKAPKIYVFAQWRTNSTWNGDVMTERDLTRHFNWSMSLLRRPRPKIWGSALRGRSQAIIFAQWFHTTIGIPPQIFPSNAPFWQKIQWSPQKSNSVISNKNTKIVFYLPLYCCNKFALLKEISLKKKPRFDLCGHHCEPICDLKWKPETKTLGSRVPRLVTT